MISYGGNFCERQNRSQKGYIPTIGEMQSWYEDDSRKEALKSSKYENNKK